MKNLLTGFLLLSCSLTIAQAQNVTGQIIDVETREPLAFVHVMINNSSRGTTSSINGRFFIKSDEPIDSITFSYVGYKNLTLTIDLNTNLQQLLVALTPDTKLLGEVEFLAGENPALPIIRKVIKYSKENNPNELNSYYLKSYNKFYMDAQHQNPEKLLTAEKPDSSMIEFYNYLHDKYIFLMESITEKKFKKPDLINEKVLANEISGLQNNTFATLANSFQPFSFYDKELQIMGVNFINPISKPGMRRYFYSLQDSIISPKDTIYIIGFEPDTESVELLSGLLYINTRNWAIQNVISNYHNDESFTFKVQQKYEIVDGGWFPVQLNTDIVFNNLDMDGFLMKGVGRSYLYDIKVDPEVKSNEFNRMALSFDEGASNRSDEYWQQHRKEPMTSRGNRTVTYLDSVSQEFNFDKIVKIVETLLTGSIPIGFIDIPFNRIVRVNNVERFRLGLGVKTNDKLSRYFSLNSYFAYGTRDQGWKYGGGVDLFPQGNKDFSLDFKYSWDLMATGVPQYYQNNFSIFSTDSYRNLIVQLMDRVEMYQGGVHFFTMKYFDVYASLTKMQKTPYTNNYQYVPHDEVGGSESDLIQSFNYTLAGLQIKYARTQYYPFLSQKIPIKDNYPVIFLNYYRGFDNLLGGEYEFNKIDFQLQKRFKLGIKNSDFTLRAGWIDRALPYTEQYFMNGTNTGDLSLFITNSFVTMALNEFLTDRYATMHYRQEILKLGNRDFYLRFDGHGNAGWGSLQNPSEHSLPYRSMEKGFYEGGLTVNFPFLIDNIEWVLGSFYRLGEYSYNDWQDNLAFVFSVEASF